MKPVEQRGAAIIKRLPQGAAVAEIGVLMGALSGYLLRQRPDITLLMVDSWLTADQQPQAYRATNDDHANHTDPARVAGHRQKAEAVAARFPGRAKIMEMSSAEAAALVPDRSLDLVFLDADHSEEGVTADLNAWAPKVKPRGWLAGHDIDNPDPRFRFGVTEAVTRFCGERGLSAERDRNFTYFMRMPG